MIETLRDAAKRLLSIGRGLGEATVGQKLFQQQRLLNTLAYRRTEHAIRCRQSVEQTSADVLDTVLTHEPGWHPYRVTALQHREELEAFLRFLQTIDPETVLEIGTFQGGTLWVWTRALDSVRRVTCIDKPVWNEMIHQRRRELYPTFSADVEIELLFGDSHAESTYEEATRFVDESVDFLFIDGDHSYEGVKQDFEMYRHLVGDDGIIAFHDIKRHATNQREKTTRLRRIEDLRERHVTVGRQRWNGVSTFWEEIRDEYTTREFLSHPEQMGAGIGIVEL